MQKSHHRGKEAIELRLGCDCAHNLSHLLSGLRRACPSGVTGPSLSINWGFYGEIIEDNHAREFLGAAADGSREFGLVVLTGLLGLLSFGYSKDDSESIILQRLFSEDGHAMSGPLNEVYQFFPQRRSFTSCACLG